jgi:CRP-like cAMP-binding protein
MVDKLIRRLETFTVLSVEEKRALQSTVRTIQQLGPREELLADDGAKGVSVLSEGFACQYKLLPDGRRQIVGYLVPGDACDLRVYNLKQTDHNVSTVTLSTIAILSQEALAEVVATHPNLGRALWLSGLVDDAIAREWIVNVGQRTSYERIAHLLCEVLFRLDAVGLVVTNSCYFPVTQEELADTVAVSSVHVNRVLQELRQEGLITLRDKRLTVLNIRGLQKAAQFTAQYMQLGFADGQTGPYRI